MASPVFIEEDVTIFRCFALSVSNSWIVPLASCSSFSCSAIFELAASS